VYPGFQYLWKDVDPDLLEVEKMKKRLAWLNVERNVSNSIIRRYFFERRKSCVDTIY